MKVKVEFLAYNPETLKGSRVTYVVSSLWELLDRVMRLRQSKHLTAVYVVTADGKDRYAVARRVSHGYKSHSRLSYLVPFSGDDVKDNDRFDEFLNRVWTRILETEKEVSPDRIDRTGVPVPERLRKSKRN